MEWTKKNDEWHSRYGGYRIAKCLLDPPAMSAEETKPKWCMFLDGRFVGKFRTLQEAKKALL
jgi:hypothetical protein